MTRISALSINLVLLSVLSLPALAAADQTPEYTAARIDVQDQPTASKGAQAERWYQEGIQFKKNRQYKESALAFKKAADQGFSSAQYSLGVLYKEGLGVQQDDVEAYAWWGLAADSGNTKAQDALDAVKDELEQNEQKMGAIYQRIMELKAGVEKP